jgi:GAF domain-containing protein
MSDAAFEDSFAALSSFFVGESTMETTLHRVAELACSGVPGVTYAGMSLKMPHRKVATTVYNHPDVPEIDQAQYDANSGPCLDALRSGEINRIDSTPRDQRWPEFSQACVTHGIFSTLSLPLTVESETSGALNLYASESDAFDEEKTRTAVLFAAQAAVVLANASAYWGARAKAEQLELALASRAVIDQAKGIVMGTLRCTPDEAFEILIKQSQQQNVKLKVVAEEIVQNASRRP